MKKKLLYISSITPDRTSGAHIAIYRHLVLRNDFDVSVASIYTHNVELKEKFTLHKSYFAQKISKTRFARYYYNLKYFANWYILPLSLLDYAKAFKPDFILTVADNYHGGLALRLARELDIPLIVNFQDLSPLSNFIPKYKEPFKLIRKFLIRKFHYLNKVADFVFYTSEGMEAFFAPRDKSSVLYPIGDIEMTAIAKPDVCNKEFTILYAGNCYGAYGRMLLKLAKSIKQTKGVHLEIFPVGKGWSDEDINEMTEAGIYKSFMSFDRLKKEFLKADAFLTVMSFEADERSFVSTSFTTKWLDYAKYGKPVISWAPPYASATIFANTYKSAIVIDNDSPYDLINEVLSLTEDNIDFYGKKSIEISSSLFDPELIHQVFVEGINSTLISK